MVVDVKVSMLQYKYKTSECAFCYTEVEVHHMLMKNDC